MEMYELTPKELPEAIKRVLAAGRVPFITAPPGVGKSFIVAQISKEAKLKLHDVRLAQADPTDLCGFPIPNQKENSMSFLPPDHFPIEGRDSIQKGDNGFLVFLDEFSSAPIAVQSAAYKLILDRMVGAHHLHPKCYIIAAGNDITHGAIANRIGTAMQSRLIHIVLKVSQPDWLEWSINAGIDYRVRAFIRANPKELMVFDPKHNDKTFACPRTYHFLSDLLRPVKGNTFSKIDQALFAGAIGMTGALKFITYSRIYSELATLDEMLAAPESVKIPDEPSSIYAMLSLLSYEINQGNVEKLMTVLCRTPKEFQAIFVKEIYQEKPEVHNAAAITAWKTENAQIMFD